jgi:hypothetical protein
VNPETQNDGGVAGSWTNSFLEEMKRTGDPLGDEIVNALFNEHGIEAVNSLWIHLRANDEISPANAPKEIQMCLEDYLQKSAVMPACADAARIKQGEAFFERRGIFCLVSLMTASLIECYALRDEAAVLGSTRNLINHAYRRVFETTQLIVAVMKEGGLGKGGDGVKTIQKVRLMHAAIRHLILKNSGTSQSAEPPKSFSDAVSRMDAWNVSKSGQPINQEQLAYTLLTFSYVILEAFEKMKISTTPDERAAYLHCWNVAGHLMGVRSELLASNFEDAGLLFSRIKEREMAASQYGQALANALVDCGRDIIQRETDKALPRWICLRLPPVIMRMLVDKKTLAIVKIRWLTPFEWILLNILRIMAAVAQGVYQKVISERFGQAIVRRLTKMPRENRPLFQIPDQLRSSWKIKRP